MGMKKYIILFPVIFVLSIATSCSEYMDDVAFKTGLNDGLVSYWPVMGTDSSGLEYDYKRHNNITNNGTATKVTGKYSTALSIPVAATISCSSFSFPISNEATISTWARINSARGFYILLRYNTEEIALEGGPNYVSVIFKNTTESAEIAWDNSLFDTWVYFCGTFDGKDLKLYINGNLAASTPSTTSLAPFNTLSLGNGCLLDEIRIYNRALSQDEIKALMDIGMD
jgi:hypothetical protein